MWHDLPEDVLEELLDAQFSNRRHYSKATSALGCRGPLCKKVERDKARAKTAARAAAAGREYKPAEPGPARARDELLDTVITWHITTGPATLEFILAWQLNQLEGVA